MISARWLFENHKKHLAMAKYYQELLERPGDQTINGIPQASQQILDYEKALQECETYLLYYNLIGEMAGRAYLYQRRNLL